MALRAIVGTGLQPDGAFHASRSGWKFRGADTINTFWLREALNNSSLVGQFRQNNDGPGFTANRTTTTPDRYRPIPFKAIAAGASLIYEPAMRRRDRL